MPGNGLSLAIRIGRQDQRIVAFQGFGDIVDAFLGQTTAFKRHPILPGEIALPDGAITAAGDLRTLPHHWAEVGGMDGFYAARLTCVA